jgi:hypothetical protein
MLYHACAQQVMHIQSADQFILGVGGGLGVDPGALHYLQYFCGPHAGVDGLAIGGHDILNQCRLHPAINDAAQIAIGKDPDKLACWKQQTESVAGLLPCKILLQQHMPILQAVGPVGRFEQGGLV